MLNQKFHHSLVESNLHITNISRIHLQNNRHMINSLVNAPNGINDTVYNISLANDSFNYATCFLLTLDEMTTESINYVVDY